MELDTDLDKIKKAIRETVLDTVVGPEVLIDIALVLREFNIPTFLTKQATEMIMHRLTVSSLIQEATFGFLTELRYHLLTFGIEDQAICKLVVDSVNVLSNSVAIPEDYKTLVVIPEEHKTDAMLCLLYLLRINVTYLEESLVAKANKEK